MNLKEARESYYFYSGKASDVARQLAFAGIAIIWIFRVADQRPGRLALPDELLGPLQVFACTLLLDLLQYAYGALAWGLYHRKKEQEKLLRNDQERVFTAPRYINWPTMGFFILKLVATAVGYLLLVWFIRQRL